MSAIAIDYGTICLQSAQVATRTARAIESLAASMRSVGAGRARLGDLELDLTVPPAPVRAPLMMAPAPDVDPTVDPRDAVRFAATGGVRRRLPMGGGT